MLDADSVIAAFSEDHVERLTGLTKRQLRYWDRTGFFVPAYADEDRRLAYSRLYSFKDVVALRTLSVLRKQYAVPLQHLRKVAEKLSHLENGLWTRITLYVLNRRVVFDEPGSNQMRDVVSGQYVIGIPLERIISDTTRDVRKLYERPAEKRGRIERCKHVNRNEWVVAGTRIPTAAIRRFHEAGYSMDEIIVEYPDLTKSDIQAALAHEEKLRAAA